MYCYVLLNLYRITMYLSLYIYVYHIYICIPYIYHIYIYIHIWMSCHVMSRHVTSRHVTSCHVMSCMYNVCIMLMYSVYVYIIYISLNYINVSILYTCLYPLVSEPTMVIWSPFSLRGLCTRSRVKRIRMSRCWAADGWFSWEIYGKSMGNL